MLPCGAFVFWIPVDRIRLVAMHDWSAVVDERGRGRGNAGLWLDSVFARFDDGSRGRRDEQKPSRQSRRRSEEERQSAPRSRAQTSQQQGRAGKKRHGAIIGSEGPMP